MSKGLMKGSTRCTGFGACGQAGLLGSVNRRCLYVIRTFAAVPVVEQDFFDLCIVLGAYV